MNKILVYGLGLIAVLGGAVSITGLYIPAFGQYGSSGGQAGGVQTASPAQIEECKSLGIPVFTCTEQLILAKKRLINAQQATAYGSGTPMFGKGFGDMGALVAILGAIFGGVAAAFFVMARRAKKEAPMQ